MEKTPETIRLFKSVIIDTHKDNVFYDYINEVYGKTVPLGFAIDSRIISSLSKRELNTVINIVKKECLVSGDEINTSFHKSWDKIKNADIKQLIIEQIAHYITTYGYESVGKFNQNTIYVPNEELEVPKLTGDIKLIYISAITKKELKERLLKLINSGIALKDSTIKDIMSVSELVDFTNEEVNSMENKEVKIAMYEQYGFFPSDPVEFLRYVTYITTKETLLIKNRALIEKIKSSDKEDALDMFMDYKDTYGLEKLSAIFNRFKPIFLAFKGDHMMNSIINKIRKLAKNNHKPMEEDFLNSITGKLKNYEEVKMSGLLRNLRNVNIFRKIRLAYALKFRTTGCDSVLYRVRNGRGYAKGFKFDNIIGAEKLLKATMQEIAADIYKNVNGKKIYIPEGVTYALPSTEKMFTGNIPSGSYVNIDKNMIFGIHWYDVPGHRVDLDLSLINATEKFGWDGLYRSGSRDILFSGDMTSAGGKNGASELFYIKNMMPSVNIMSVNYFNHSSNHPVPFKIVVGEERLSNLDKNHMIDPNNIKAVSNSVMTDKQKTLGIAVTDKDGCKFYFTENNMCDGISSRVNDATEHARKFLYNYYSNSITLNELLLLAGAELVENQENADIDLSLESLEKDTIINLLVGNE